MGESGEFVATQPKILPPSPLGDKCLLVLINQQDASFRWRYSCLEPDTTLSQITVVLIEI